MKNLDTFPFVPSVHSEMRAVRMQKQLELNRLSKLEVRTTDRCLVAFLTRDFSPPPVFRIQISVSECESRLLEKKAMVHLAIKIV
jgi:hypothetical protein